MNFIELSNYKRIFLFVLAATCYGLTPLRAGQPLNLEAKIDSALALQESEHYAESIALLNSVEPDITEKTPTAIRYKFYDNQSYNYFVTWNMRKAEDYAQLALEVAIEAQDTSLLVRAYSQMGNVYAKQKRTPQSINYQEKALGLLGPADSAKYYALLLNISNSLTDAERFGESLKYLLKAKLFYQNVGNTDRLSVIENNIGELYRDGFEDFQRAITHYRIAAQINSKDGNTEGLIKNYHNLGLTYLATNNTDSALVNIQRSIRLRQIIGDEAGKAHGYNLLGELYVMEGKLEQARESYLTMAKISSENSIEPGIYYSNMGLARVASLEKDRASELRYLKRAEIASGLMQTPNIQKDISSHLYRVYKRNGNFKNALSQLELYMKVDSTTREDLDQNALDELRIKYENKLALSENELLKSSEKSKNQQLAKQHQTLMLLWVALTLILIFGIFAFRAYNQRKAAFVEVDSARKELERQYAELKMNKEKLATANDLKNLIFSVIGHDLREPLSALSQILMLANSGDLTRDEMDLLLHHIQGQTDTNLKSLQNILLWARTQIDQGAIHQGVFDSKDIISDILQKYEPQIKNKKLKIHQSGKHNLSMWADLNQFKSMVQNLLSNAIKFSPFEETIEISMEENRDHYVLKISDYGVGVSNEFLENLEKSGDLISSRGTDGEKGTGIGLRLVQEFVKAHKGKFYFEPNRPTGTIAVIELPKKEFFEQLLEITDVA